MKARIIILLLAVVPLRACTTPPVQPSFEILAIDTLLGSPTPGYNIEYRFASIINADKSPALDAIERANISYFFELEEFAGSVQEAKTKVIDQTVQQILSEEFMAPDRVPGTISTEISAKSEGVVVDSLLCCTITRSKYAGGAHGMYGTECHTYSLASGNECTIADLFGKERVAELVEAIRQKLYTQYEVTNDNELYEKGFYPECINIAENFQITPAGITFIYNSLEIGRYTLGVVKVPFSMEKLQTH